MNRMKHVLMVLMVCFAFTNLASAQKGKLSLNLTGGYTFPDRVKFDAAYTDVQDAFQYGGSLEYFTSARQSLELSYQRMDTRFPLYGPAGNHLNEGDDDGSINYILLGGNSYLGSNSEAKTMPFIGGGAGVGILNAGGESATKFAWNFKGGVKINASPNVSFKLNAYVQSVISTFGNDFWVTNVGVVAVPDYASIFQFGLGGAVTFHFPSRK